MSHFAESLHVTEHAVERLRERARVLDFDDDACQRVISQAVLPAIRSGSLEPHYFHGQVRARLSVLGVDAYAIMGPDWRESPECWDVVTILTPEQVAAGPTWMQRQTGSGTVEPVRAWLGTLHRSRWSAVSRVVRSINLHRSYTWDAFKVHSTQRGGDFRVLS